MRFWDASALLPLIVTEPGSDLARAWLREDPEVVLWGWTRVELVSAIERRAREGLLTSAQRRAALVRVEKMVHDAHEILDLAAVRVRATAVLARQKLRAADAGQLGAALLVAEPNPASLIFVVLDRQLADAAERESLTVLSWPDR